MASQRSKKKIFTEEKIKKSKKFNLNLENITNN